MIQKLLFSFLSYLLFLSAHAQKPEFPKKVKVVLLGTFHFGETSDRNKTVLTDLFSKKRQSELDDLVKSLNAAKPSKIFVEAPVSSQQRIDSLYNIYRRDKLKDTVILRNEIEQIGFRLARLSNLPSLRCVDYRQELPYEAMDKFEKGIGADTTIKFPPFFDIPYPFTDSTRKLSLKKMTLPQYLRGMNDEYHRQQFQFDYLHYAMSYGYKEDYTGADYTTAWYGRNLKIFTNILRDLQPSDQCIVILFGSSHTNTLRQFFENHPSFQILDLETILK